MLYSNKTNKIKVTSSEHTMAQPLLLHSLLQIKPYSVLGAQVQPDNGAIVEAGEDPASLPSCVVVDVGRMHISRHFF